MLDVAKKAAKQYSLLAGVGGFVFGLLLMMVLRRR